MSENPTNRERSRHVDVRVHFLRDMVRDGSVKLIKCAGTQNVADALTKSLPRPAFHKHREFLKGTSQSFSAFFASAYEPCVPAYVTKRGTHRGAYDAEAIGFEHSRVELTTTISVGPCCMMMILLLFFQWPLRRRHLGGSPFS
jgi:hypothetical protein